jgi:methionyl-tRNA formyltransferase
VTSGFIFFGTDDLARRALAELRALGLDPVFVVDRKIDAEIEARIRELGCEFAVLVSYGKIVPARIIELFPKGILNIHPSLLPKLRGPSPIKSAILENYLETGVSIMLLDKELDHGPILAQRKIDLSPKTSNDLELGSELLRVGTLLLNEILPDYLSGKLEPKEQDHSFASFTRKFDAKDGLIDKSLILGQSRLDEVTLAERKVRALNHEPGTYCLFDTEKGPKRVKVLSAKVEGAMLVPNLVQPAGKKPMDWDSFRRGNKLLT